MEEGGGKEENGGGNIGLIFRSRVYKVYNNADLCAD